MSQIAPEFASAAPVHPEEAAVYAAMAPHEPGQFANHATPLIRNCWYAAGRSSEIGRTPLARILLDVNVVLWRTEAGLPVAMRNRCPHRSFPLARGKLVGDRLICGYHGMEFGSDGACAHMPALNAAPSTAYVQTFPIVDRGPTSWIWMGAPDLADESLIPDTAWLSDPAWGTVTGEFHIKSDYVSMHENLIDQTHFPFLHPGAVGTPEYARSTLHASTENNQVLIRRELLNSALPASTASRPISWISASTGPPTRGSCPRRCTRPTRASAYSIPIRDRRRSIATTSPISSRPKTTIRSTIGGSIREITCRAILKSTNL